jgi:hypothetical protein
VFRSARVRKPTNSSHDSPYGYQIDTTPSDLNSDVSEYDAGSPLLDPVPKLSTKTHRGSPDSGAESSHLSLNSFIHDDEMIRTTPKPIEKTPLSRTSRRKEAEQQSRYIGSDIEDDKLVDANSDSESAGDYDIAQSDGESEEDFVTLEDSEEWEVIDKEVFDNTTNSFKQIPSTIFADDSIQQTLKNYVEKYIPTEHQIEQFRNALGVLKFAAEFGYNAIKEPMVDWAEDIVRGKLNCGLDEVPKLFLTRLLNRMPERTRTLLVKVPGSVCIPRAELGCFELTLHRTFRRHGFVEVPEGQMTHVERLEAD